MSNSFQYGKKGRKLSPLESMVKQMNTWHIKTLRRTAANMGIACGDLPRHQLIALIIETSVERTKEPAS